MILTGAFHAPYTMRIDRLDLTAFGPFTDVSLDLSGGSEGLHIVYGPNEAGKSSALRAIRQFFCEIPPRSPDDFVHDYKKMAVGAAVRGHDGVVVELLRRKGAKNTLLNRDGTAVADGDARLARLLGGVDAADFARRFVIDRAELVEGGRDVVAGKGDLGRALFAAGGGGLARVGGVQKELERLAEERFLPRGSKPTINADLARLEELRKQLKVATLPSSEWVEHDRALREAQAREAAIDGELLAADRERNRLTRVAEAVSPAAQRREVLAELAGLADVPRLSEGFLPAYRDAVTRIPESEQAEAEARRRVAELCGQIEALDVPEALLDQAEAIEGLHQRLGGLIRAAADRRNREAELARLEAEARAALRDLGRDPDATSLEGADGPLQSLRLTTAARAEVLALIDQRAERLAARDEARKKLEGAAAKREVAAARLAALGPERDPSPLRKALKQVQKAGDLDEQLRKDRTAHRRDEAKAATALAALGRWTGPLEAVEALAVPSAEAVDAFQAELDGLDREIADLDGEVDELGRAAREADARLEQLRLQGDVPSEDALADARRLRDEAWRQLRAAWDNALADAYEPAVRGADALADRLRREATRVADHAQVVTSRTRAQVERDERQRRREQIEVRRVESRTRWAALWAAAGVAEPGPPREMHGWLRRQADVAALARGVREKRGELVALEGQIDDHRRNLLAALSAAGETAVADESLADLVERAGDVIDQIKAQTADRKRFRQEVESHDAERPGLEQAAAAADLAWERWQAGWGAALRPLGLAADAAPAAAHAVLARSAELFERLDRARALRVEIEATAREAERFAADVQGLARRVAPELAPRDVPFDAEAVAALLNERLKRARAARQEYEHLLAARDEKEQAAEFARASAAQHREALAALRREARCESDDDLPAVHQRDQHRRVLEAERDRLEVELRRLAAGAPLEAFAAEVEQADPDTLAPLIARLDEKIAGWQEDRRVVNQQIGAERARLDQMKGGSDAALLKQQEEDLRARVKDDVEQYARLRLAASVLRAGIERYRQKAQNPVLARAGETFARLTLGSFASLRVDYDDHDEPVLIGVRPGGEPVGVGGMSLGTADQLYLALRLATLDAALDRHEPLPLIVDDVLVQFDDARAAATLEALAAFSKRAQVLLFTHHDHLVRLAEDRLGPGVVLTHRLPGRVVGEAG